MFHHYAQAREPQVGGRASATLAIREKILLSQRKGYSGCDELRQGY